MCRLDWVDRLKGLLIILVVAGHAVGSAEHFTDGVTRDILHFSFKAIYLFHMPAFFVLAGFLFREMPWREFLRRKFRRLVVPYLIFGIISIVIFIGMVGWFSPAGSTDSYYRNDYAAITWWQMAGSLLYGASLPGTDGFRCNSVLWFLPCLFTCNVLLRVLTKWCSRWLLALLSIALVPLYVFVIRMGMPSLPWGLSRLFVYLPFALLGWMLPRKLSFDRWHWLLMPVAYLIACHWSPYDGILFDNYVKWPVVMLMGVFGTTAACVLANWIRLDWLAKLGSASIGIMLMHKWVLLAFYKVGYHGVVLPTCLALFVCCAATRCLARFVPWMIGGKGGKGGS